MDHCHPEQQQQEETPSPLLLLPNDVWEHILGRTDPRAICSLACSAPCCLRLAARARRGVQLARKYGRLQLLALRHGMEARDEFVSRKICNRRLLSREASQAQILDLLQRSPDPIPDLAAATQQSLALITSQGYLCPTLAAPIRADLVRCANYVCVLAWRQHMKKVRARNAAARQGVAVAAAAAGVAAAPQQAAVAADARAPQQQQQQQQEAAAQPQQVGAAAVQAAAVQTELGPSLIELQELLTGFGALMASPGNPSLRLTAPSLNMLQHLLARQPQAWNLPQPQAQGDDQEAPVGAAVAPVGGGAAEGAGVGAAVSDELIAAVGADVDEVPEGGAAEHGA